MLTLALENFNNQYNDTASFLVEKADLRAYITSFWILKWLKYNHLMKILNQKTSCLIKF